jgi:hypothetical protein
MTEPTKEQLKLVSAIVNAIADYNGERHGNFACHVQAAGMACREFGWDQHGITPTSFFRVERFFVAAGE